MFAKDTVFSAGTQALTVSTVSSAGTQDGRSLSLVLRRQCALDVHVTLIYGPRVPQGARGFAFRRAPRRKGAAR